MATNDPAPPPAPLFDGRNLVRASVTAALSGGALAATLYAPRWPIPCAIIALVIVAFAAQMNISLVNPGVIVPQVRIVSSLPLTEAAPPEREIVTTGPVTTVAVEQPPAAASHRDRAVTGTGEGVPLGAFAPVKRSHHAAKVPVVTPVDAVSDH